MDYKTMSANFFSNVPRDFFTILASPNKELYLSALFVVRAAFEDKLTIDKKELKEQILISLENSIEAANLEADLDEEDGVEAAEELSSLPGRASFLVKKLISRGWLLEEDSKQGFEKSIVIPDYASDFMEMLYHQTQPKNEAEGSDVFASYAVLRIAEGERSEHRAGIMGRALKIASDNAGELNKAFRNLYYFIGKYYREHAMDEHVRDMLEARFKEGGEQSVIDAWYHPLKTSDSIALYGGDIQKIVAEIEKDPDLIRQMARSDQSFKLRGMDEEDAVLEIRRRIDYIIRTFRTAGDKIDEITDRNADYNRRFTQAVIHNLRSDHSIVSKIVRVMKHMDEDEEYKQKVCGSLSATDSVFVDERSLRSDVARPKESDEAPKLLLRPHHEKNENASRKFLEKSFGGYTMADARKYVAEKMHGRKRMETGEIIKEMEDFTQEDYTLLIMAGLYGFASGSYSCKKSERTIEVGGYCVPDMIFERKEDKEGVV
ncbi:Wadjet anti-phage system protein JetA family protein [Butyrivibrio sp. MC2013]|uniref:Wadjet anti-phage system protein JetA family protein n=1 Tax=Butyrivibrio sp. MC2013 TaxID=1280686 RepID=UPI0003F84E75|nr:Wadjet anti-phage system protein JetA family protein [Butyrivibrio sp. MC2013]